MEAAMTLWDARFRTHQLWQLAAQAREAMNALQMPAGADEREALAHAGMVLELLEQRRDDSDPREIAPSMLNAAASAASNFATALQHVLDGNYAWSQVVQPADDVLVALGQWPPMKPARYFGGVYQAAESFLKKTNELLGEVARHAKEVDDAIADGDQKATALTAKIEQERQRITEAIATFTTESAKAVDDLIDGERARIEEHVKEWDAERQSAAKSAQDVLAQLREHEESAKNVVHETTSRIVATDYRKYARNKTIAAWVCDVAAAVVGATGVGFMLYHLLVMDPSADANVGLSMTRLAVSLGTLGVATLLGRRAHQHHQEARAAKRTDLALRQVLPFTANLQSDEREEIILSFTERVFIRGDLDIKAPATEGLGLRERIAARRADRREREEKARLTESAPP